MDAMSLRYADTSLPELLGANGVGKLVCMASGGSLPSTSGGNKLKITPTIEFSHQNS